MEPPYGEDGDQASGMAKANGDNGDVPDDAKSQRTARSKRS